MTTIHGRLADLCLFIVAGLVLFMFRNSEPEEAAQVQLPEPRVHVPPPTLVASEWAGSNPLPEAIKELSKDYLDSWSLDVPGPPLTTNTPLRRGQYVQALERGRVYSAMVLDVLEDGRVWAHRTGASSHYDDYPCEPSELRMAPPELLLNQPFSSGELDAILSDLRFGDEDRIEEACEKLAVRGPHEPNEEIAEALCRRVISPDGEGLDEAAEALLLMRDSDDTVLKRSACLAITQWKTDAGIEKVASLVPMGSSERYYASPALRFMGPRGEPVAIGLLDHKVSQARRDGCLALVVLGTEAAIPKLQELVDRSDYASYAAQAISAIRIRALQ